MGDRLRESIPPRYVTKPTRFTQPCIPSGSLNRVSALIGWGKGGNVTYAGWQVTLCDPIWHTSSCKGCLRTDHLPLPLPSVVFFVQHVAVNGPSSVDVSPNLVGREIQDGGDRAPRRPIYNRRQMLSASTVDRHRYKGETTAWKPLFTATVWNTIQASGTSCHRLSAKTTAVEYVLPCFYFLIHSES